MRFTMRSTTSTNIFRPDWMPTPEEAVKAQQNHELYEALSLHWERVGGYDVFS